MGKAALLNARRNAIAAQGKQVSADARAALAPQAPVDAAAIAQAQAAARAGQPAADIVRKARVIGYFKFQPKAEAPAKGEEAKEPEIVTAVENIVATMPAQTDLAVAAINLHQRTRQLGYLYARGNNENEYYAFPVDLFSHFAVEFDAIVAPQKKIVRP